MQILPSKLSLPRLPSFVVERERLLSLVNDCNVANGIILCAPAGYGKTVLAIQYLNRYVEPNCRIWVDLDRFDNSQEQLLSYILAGLSQKNRIVRESKLLDNLQASSPIEIVDNLCLLFQEYIETEYLIVLDNWETIDNKETADVIHRLINHAADKIKIIINSRVKPSFKLQKLREKNRVQILNKTDLQLTFTEFVEAINKRTDSPLEEDELERLWKLTSGWCINLGNIVSSLARGEQPVAVDEYINEELFSDLDEPVLNNLLIYSTLETITPEGCRVLTEDESEVDRFLKLLRTLPIPLYEMSEKNHFRLHPQVKESARTYLAHKFETRYVSSIYQKVADYYRSDGNLMQAIESLLMIENYPQVIEILDNHWNDIVQMNLPGNVGKWLDEIPGEYRRDPVYIKTRSNYLTLIGDNRQMLEYLSDKINYSDYPRGDETLASLWSNYSWSLINSANSPQYDTVLKSYKKLIKENGPFSDISMAIFENVMSVAAHLELKYATALKHLNRCLEFMPDEYVNNRVIGLQNMGLFNHELGHSRKAIQFLGQSVSLAHAENVLTSLFQGTMIEASIALARGRYRKTIALVEKCIEQMKENGLFNVGTQMYAERFKGEALWYLGEKEEGLELIANSLNASAYHSNISIVTTKKLIEFYSYHTGLTKDQMDDTDQAILQYDNEARPIHLADLAIRKLNESKSGVKVLVDQLENLAVKRKLKPWQITSSFIQAVHCYNKGQITESRKFVTRGLNLMRKMEWSSYPLANEFLSASVYCLAVKFGVGLDTAERLFSDEHNFVPTGHLIGLLNCSDLDDTGTARFFDSITRLKISGFASYAREKRDSGSKQVRIAAGEYMETAKQLELPPLRIYMFGRFEVYADGRKCHTSRKKSKQLLQYLLLAEDHSAHEEQLIEQFWPESDPSKGKAVLRTTVKDLRKSLDAYYEPRKKSYITYQDQHYSLDLPENSMVDYWQFESDLLKYKSRKVAEFSNSDVKDFYKALSLYRGLLLPKEMYQSYTIDRREYIQSLHQSSLLIYARVLGDRNRSAEVITDLEKALEDDPLWREGVESLMSIHVHDGRLFRAIRTYKDYEKMLNEELGIPPDEDLKEYFQSIM